MMDSKLVGFSVLEFLIYFLITQLFLLIIMQWMSTQSYSIKKEQHACMRSMSLYGAYDRLVYDLRKIELHQPYDVHENCCVARQGQHDIGWELVKNKLFRSEGSYNYNEHSWVHRHKNLVADALESLQCEFHYNNGIVIGMSATLSAKIEGQSVILKGFTRMRNGVVL